MRVIPVLDVKNGLVVRARMGDRANYRPIETPLARGAQPLDVAEGLLRLHPFGALYVADLDAIEGRARNDATVAALAGRWPGLEIWVDAGLRDEDEIRAWCSATGARAVLGTESGVTPATLGRLADRDPVLSLDHRGVEKLGDPSIFADAASWPRDVVVMTLARVGGADGPDFDRLVEVRRMAGPERRVFAAGGVRGPDDLDGLTGAGIAGALVASALHDGRLDGRALDRAAGGLGAGEHAEKDRAAGDPPA